MKKLFAIAVIAFFMLLPVFAAAPCSAADEEVVTHTVKAGDTLWGIAHKYFKDPKGWMGIWKNNPEVRNPHLIRPGDIIRLSTKKIEVERNGKVVEEIVPEEVTEEVPKEVPEEIKEEVPAVVEEEEEEEAPTPVTRYSKTTPVEVPAAEPPKEQASLKLTKVASEAISRSGFVTKSKMVMLGKIVKGKESSIIFMPNTSVYVAFRDPKNIEVGDRFTAYRRSKKELIHPKTKKSLGNIVEFLGTIEVTGVHEDVIEAIIISSFKEITREDPIMEYQPPVNEVALKESNATVNGIVVGTYEDELISHSNNIVYIDKGLDDGIDEGTVFTVHKKGSLAIDPYDKKKKRKIPSREIARVVVVKAGEKTSTAFVIDGSEPIDIGDDISTKLPKEEEPEATDSATAK